MFTPNDKRRIYSAITAAFPTEEEYSFEKIDALLNKNGFRSADFGYAKRRNMLEDLPEFLTLKETVIGQNRHLLVDPCIRDIGIARRLMRFCDDLLLHVFTEHIFQESNAGVDLSF